MLRYLMLRTYNKRDAALKRGLKHGKNGDTQQIGAGVSRESVLLSSSYHRGGNGG